METRLIRLEEADNAEFYEISDAYGEGKCIHIFCYYYERDASAGLNEDNEPETWARVEGTFIIVPLEEFIQRYAEEGVEYLDMELWAETKQYQEDMSERQARGEIEGMENILHYSEITMDTPCGNYVSLRK